MDNEDSVVFRCNSDSCSRSDLSQMPACNFPVRPFSFLGEKVMADDEFTCDLFRFLQLLCEGHNNGESQFQMCITNKQINKKPVDHQLHFEM